MDSWLQLMMEVNDLRLDVTSKAIEELTLEARGNKADQKAERAWTNLMALAS